MLLTIFAISVGCVIGRLRGGSFAGVTSAQFHRPGFLVLGLTTTLVLNMIGPGFPLLWALVGTGAFFFFGFRNLQLTGMIVMLIGLLMNTVPLLANGSVPVSDLALVSVGDVDDSGRAVVDGLRESTDTASTFAAFGDVVPVPLVGAVVSIGDLVMLIALGDIAANLFLRTRKRETLDDGGVTFAEAEPVPERPAVMSPLSLGVSSRPAHAAHRRPRRKAAPSTHVPAHAKQSDFFDLTDPDTVIVLDGAEAYVESGVAKTKIPEVPKPASTVVPSTTEVVVPKTEIILPDEPVAPGATPAHAEEPATNEPETAEPKRADDNKAETSTGSVDNNTGNVETSTGSVDNNMETSTGSVDNKVETSTGSVDNNTERADRRPIIDLTVSPTDEQLQEFLRRRAEADAELLARATPGPRRRRGRAPRRAGQVAEVSR